MNPVGKLIPDREPARPDKTKAFAGLPESLSRGAAPS
ncbi:hypothetical protein J2S53_004441 [Actinopolyspora lacussalsi]|nr:hypothetical protein [Actinopolyspora lacussalsi]